jgi:fructose-1,6-bisphosphatase/inositol monophosphatase family enzyme
LSLNKKDNYAGGPSSTNVRDYDIIAGLLFQSEVGAHFTPMQDDMKGFNFDPKLTFTDRQILLKIPKTAKELKCDSLRVAL